MAQDVQSQLDMSEKKNMKNKDLNPSNYPQSILYQNFGSRALRLCSGVFASAFIGEWLRNAAPAGTRVKVANMWQFSHFEETPNLDLGAKFHFVITLYAPATYCNSFAPFITLFNALVNVNVYI